MKNLVSVFSILLAMTVLSSQAHAFFDLFRPWPRQQQVPPPINYGNMGGESYYDQEYLKEITPKPTSYQLAPFSISDLEYKPWLKAFKYIIVVNKSKEGPSKQTITIYEDGYKIKSEKISSGREIFERARETEDEKRPDTPYWSITPTGYFNVKWLSKNHKSSSWKVAMPWAVFFDLKNGIALHEVPRAYVKNLGTRASGGCVRLTSTLAQEVFERIQKTAGAKVPQVRQDGTPVLDKNRNIVLAESTTLYDKVKEPSYSALIIVQNVNE